MQIIYIHCSFLSISIAHVDIVSLSVKRSDWYSDYQPQEFLRITNSRQNLPFSKSFSYIITIHALCKFVNCIT